MGGTENLNDMLQNCQWVTVAISNNFFKPRVWCYLSEWDTEGEMNSKGWRKSREKQ